MANFSTRLRTSVRASDTTGLAVYLAELGHQNLLIVFGICFKCRPCVQE